MRIFRAACGLKIHRLSLHGGLLHVGGCLLGQVVGVVYFVFSLDALLALHREDISLEDAHDWVVVLMEVWVSI